MMMKKLLALFFVFFGLTAQGQTKIPLQTNDSLAQKKWVDSILNTMTIDQKIGQLFMIQAYSNKDKKHEDYIENMLQKYHVGNLIFMQGTPDKQAFLTNKYQAFAKVPLLIGQDAEWGLDMRLKNTFRYPWNMTLGAIRNEYLVEQFGEQLGEQCKRLGVNINFAPDVDINTNPLNPIIGNRSFGEKRNNVTEKAAAFIKGMQSFGVLATAKHFPGHGDTSTDSHNTLPVVNFSRERLDTLELYPYKKLFRTNLASVMTAHLSVPAFEKNPKMPSSLSKNIVTNLLKNELGFKGLIITDGLNMKGAANYSSSAEINLAAILAGNDLLLIPQDIPETIELFKKSLANHTLTQARIDYSVRKILMAKYWAGLAHFKPIELADLHNDLNPLKALLLHRKLVKKSITLLKNKAAILPIKKLDKQRIAYLKIGEEQNLPFVKTLKKYTNITIVSGKNTAEIIKKLKPYNLVILGFHSSNKNPWKSYKISKKGLQTIQAIAKKKKVILDVFASPYSLLAITDFSNIEAVVVSYQNSKIAQEISAQQLFGAVAIEGRLPVSVSKKFKQGFGLLTSSINRLQYGLPEEVQMSSEKLKKIDSVANYVIREKMAPGMQILVARKGKVIYQKSFGYHTNDSLYKVKNTDLYDLASMTKVLATLPMLMKAVEAGKIKLSDDLQHILPEFKNSNKDTVTVREILSHVARLKAWIPFYKLTQDSITGKNLPLYYRYKKSRKYGIQVAKNLYLLSSYKDSIKKYIINAEQREESGYKYSDLGFYIFKEKLEKIYKKPLNILVQKYFYQALGANRMTYLPLQKFKKAAIVPTEKDIYFRHQLLHGYVHDMGAAMQGGVGGHAGLFADANDVAKMMQLYLQKGFYGGKRYLQTATIDTFNFRYYQDEKVRRGLGFDKPQLDPEIKATCGCVSDASFGHSGFTGTFTWVDPESQILYVFLSNRVYPTMENDGLVKEDIRTKIQQLIQDALLVK